jgi:hypothetical protein
MKKLLLILAWLWACPAFAVCPYGLTGVTCEFVAFAYNIVGLSDADPVTTWADTSGLSHDATAAVGEKPIYKTGILNGKAVVRYDGTMRMTTASFPRAQPTTVCLVGNATSVGGAGNYYTDDVVTGNLNMTNTDSGGLNNFGVGTLALFINDVIPSFDYAIMCGIWDGTNSLLSYNGTVIAGVLDSGDPTDAGITLGNYANAGTDFTYALIGDEFGIVAADGHLTDPQRQWLEGGLACDAGLQSLLPIGHPYKTVCPSAPLPPVPSAPSPASLVRNLRPGGRGL